MFSTYFKTLHYFTFKNGVHVRNRLTMAPMTTFSADSNDYVSQEDLIIIKNAQMG